MNMLSNCRRLFQMLRPIGRYRLETLLKSQHPVSGLRYLFYLNPWRWFAKRKLDRAEALRLALQELGPIFVKFGQALSTRRDLLPTDIADELCVLQDKVPPFAGEVAKAKIEKALGAQTNQLFSQFDIKPLASASIAQVHAATLPGGQDVVVKVLRPGVNKQVRRDLHLMYYFARLIERIWPGASRLRAVALVREFETTIIDELDLSREAANASQLRRNAAGMDICYVPEVYWDFVRRDVMVIERIHGVQISDIETLRAKGVNLEKLAANGVEIFFTQVFHDSFFHADMHPGNVFVDISDPENPVYKAVDFGIMGTLDPSDQRYLAENFLAFFNRDYRRVAQLHIDSGWVPAGTRLSQFESSIRAVCEPLFELPMSQISFGQVLLQLFQTASRFKMPVQPQLMLLQKTLINVEGLGRELYPDLDLWDTAKPFLEKWMKDQIGPKSVLKNLKRGFPYWLEKLPDIPDAVYAALRQPQRQMPVVAEQPKSLSNFWLGAAGALLASAAVNGIVYETIAGVPGPIVYLSWAFTGVGLASLLVGALKA